MTRILPIFAVLVLVASASSGYVYPPGVTEGHSWVELVEYNYITEGQEAGNWEYIYDAWGGYDAFFETIAVQFPRADLMVNVYPEETHDVKQIWAAGSAGLYGLYESYAYPEIWPSNWMTDPVTFEVGWVLNEAVEWGMLNLWHDGGEYNCNEHAWRQGDLYEWGIGFNNSNSGMWGGWMQEGLSATFRIVHPYSPGDITYWTSQGGTNGTLIGPAVAPPEHPDGDVDRDLDVDVDDIDALCDFLRGEDPVAGYRYDLSDDGENPNEGGGAVDMDDLDYLVHHAVETTIGNGTEYGDFNLDGVIDTTDLTRLATNYGDDNWKWDDGNANRYIDTNIDNTDLTILATYYGFGVPDVVPEPMTLSLLAVGAAALLRRRRRA